MRWLMVAAMTAGCATEAQIDEVSAAEMQALRDRVGGLEAALGDALDDLDAVRGRVAAIEGREGSPLALEPIERVECVPDSPVTWRESRVRDQPWRFFVVAAYASGRTEVVASPYESPDDVVCDAAWDAVLLYER